MTWEVKEGHCAECGAYGSWLEFVDAEQLPKDWFAITECERNTDCNEYTRVLLCSVKCVEARKARDRDPTSRPAPPGCKPQSNT